MDRVAPTREGSEDGSDDDDDPMSPLSDVEPPTAATTVKRKNPSGKKPAPRKRKAARPEGENDDVDEGDGAGQRVNWTIDALARLIEVLVDPLTLSVLQQSEAIPTRMELDEGLPAADIWAEDGLICQRFNHLNPDDEEYKGRFPPECTAIHHIQPGRLPSPRTGLALKARWASMKATFTVVYQNWDKSGQNDADFQANFYGGRMEILYMFWAVHGLPSIDNFVLRTIDPVDQMDEGVDDLQPQGAGAATGDVSEPTEPVRKRGRPVKADAPPQTITLSTAAAPLSAAEENAVNEAAKASAARATAALAEAAHKNSQRKLIDIKLCKRYKKELESLDKDEDKLKYELIKNAIEKLEQSLYRD